MVLAVNVGNKLERFFMRVDNGRTGVTSLIILVFAVVMQERITIIVRIMSVMG